MALDYGLNIATLLFLSQGFPLFLLNPFQAEKELKKTLRILNPQVRNNGLWDERRRWTNGESLAAALDLWTSAKMYDTRIDSS